jgi:hypothetical protein
MTGRLRVCPTVPLMVEPAERLHIGDQFLNTGNDYAARAVSPCIWIINPQDRTCILKSILRCAFCASPKSSNVFDLLEFSETFECYDGLNHDASDDICSFAFLLQFRLEQLKQRGISGSCIGTNYNVLVATSLINDCRYYFLASEVPSADGDSIGFEKWWGLRPISSSCHGLRYLEVRQGAMGTNNAMLVRSVVC